MSTAPYPPPGATPTQTPPQAQAPPQQASPPPGIYPDPFDPTKRRIWTGSAWGDLIPEPGKTGGTQTGPSQTLLIIGWLAALFFPLIGLILGLVIMNTEKETGGSQGKAIAIVSGAWMVFALLLIAASASSAAVVGALLAA